MSRLPKNLVYISSVTVIGHTGASRGSDRLQIAKY